MLEQTSGNVRNKKDYVKNHWVLGRKLLHLKLASSRVQCNGLFAIFLLSTLILWTLRSIKHQIFEFVVLDLLFASKTISKKCRKQDCEAYTGKNATRAQIMSVMEKPFIPNTNTFFYVSAALPNNNNPPLEYIKNRSV